MRTRNIHALAIAAFALFVGVLPSTARTAPAGEAPEHAAEKAPADMAPAAVGEMAPDFTLTDTDGKTHKLSDYTGQGRAIVLEWFNPECPFVKKHHQLTHSMHETYAFAKEAGVVWLAVNSGAPGKQGNGLEKNIAARKDYGMEYPVLLDESRRGGQALRRQDHAPYVRDRREGRAHLSRRDRQRYEPQDARQDQLRARLPGGPLGGEADRGERHEALRVQRQVRLLAEPLEPAEDLHG